MDTHILKVTVWRAPTGTNSRISYCVAYDVVDDRIAAMRCGRDRHGN